MAKAPDASVRSRPMTAEERKVIIASSAGTIFEWYDFYLYGSLAAIIGAQFFTPFPEATRNVFALLAFAAGFVVRPFGALVFGALGDIVGRKYTFLMTIVWHSAANTAARQFMWPNTPLPTSAAISRPLSKPPQPWACFCPWSSFCRCRVTSTATTLISLFWTRLAKR